MTRRLPFAALLVAVAGASFALARCNFFVSYTNCRVDADCRSGDHCHPQRHFCYHPAPEVCNGLDDNLNGVPDDREDFGPCQVTPGPTQPCRDGHWSCNPTSRTLTCVPITPAASETCNNGLDDDCNGHVDDGTDCQANFNSTSGMVVGSDDPAEGEGDDAPAHTVCLDAFTIDRYEVSFQAYLAYLASLDPSKLHIDPVAHPMNTTVFYGRYLQYDDAEGPVPLAYVQDPPDALSLDLLPADAGNRVGLHEPASAQLPMVNVTWLGADRYCRWAGKHLPSEAEFIRAARGATGTRPYPWGTQDPTCDLANVGRGGPDGGPCTGAPDPVTSHDQGATMEGGVYNLYGNANEWMWDQLDDSLEHDQNHYYNALAPDAWCGEFPHGPLGPDAGSPIAQPEDAGLYCVNCRFARGRHYRTVDLRISIRRWLDADRGEPYVGFRCSSGGAAR